MTNSFLQDGQIFCDIVFPFLDIYARNSPTVCVRGLALRTLALGQAWTLLGAEHEARRSVPHAVLARS
ncbi:MAG: hypothetical protein IH589_07285 [Anaerolineales bacterium]|nr:hypothetical protein [Anaerolineales bacterium]